MQELVTLFKVKVTAKVKMSVSVCPDDVFLIADHFYTKLAMVMQQHEPECHAEKLVHCLQSQGHSEGLYIYQNVTISALSSKLQVHLQPNLVW